MKRIIILLLAMILTGCTQSLDIQLEPEVSLFLSSDSGQPIRLMPDDKAYKDLSEWLQKNRSNWYVTTGRYRGGVYIQSGEHGIQVTDIQVILYATEGERPSARYIQTIKKSELRSIKNYGK
ncbi:hypothetical protein MIB92_05740 [Aestuariirhabdus sp. Z084]|uniref:hypothetical protein n=1 Tax=Aestuariirhabdus haliotis TaxID=2918751 RepID=UPI00201B41A1|nr:hypothetical protein [Aestuariirhabdus haliotis]MCL6415145.1 hypothetical protein [Aestuariirhabdus haliotis]MCL6420020.1 hypothetical protein [Aestuariirhabdus haliotis]